MQLAIRELCREIELLDEGKSSQTDLLAVLTARDLKADLPVIYLGCETTQFNYVVSRFSDFFHNLTPKAIEDSGLFYSRKGTKINAQNLYSNNSKNPKKKAEMDTITSQLK